MLACLIECTGLCLCRAYLFTSGIRDMVQDALQAHLPCISICTQIASTGWDGKG
jgi:hypothetical protein